MKLLTLLSTFAVLALPVETLAQAGGAPITRQPEDRALSRGTLTESELKGVAEQIDHWKRVEGSGGVTPRVAKSRTAAMLRALNVSCVVTDAAYRGPAPEGGAQHVYEAACEDGMGYLLMLHDSTLMGSSCLATGKGDSQVKCALPANFDSKAMAGALLKRNRVDCAVRELKWLGRNAADLEHVEVACEGGAGYVMRSPPLGSSGKLEVFSCQDAVKERVACELSPQAASVPESGADSRPSLAWFKEALNRNGVSCQSKRARIVGRESIKRRYLVEFECSDRPEGLVAFVPPAGDTVNSFESMNCALAAKRGIHCDWVSKDN